MLAAMQSGRRFFIHSLTFKNLGVFLVVFLVALFPLVRSYWIDLRENRIDILSSRLILITRLAMKNLDPAEINGLMRGEMTRGELYRRVTADLRRIQDDYEVDNAVLLRRTSSGKFTYIVDGNGQFAVAEPVALHERFPETFKVAVKSWESGAILRTGLFGFGTFEYLQVYAPIREEGRIVALLMINKFAEEVDLSIRRKTAGLLVMTVLLAVLGAAFFWIFSTRMLAPLLRLKDAAMRLSAGDLEVEVPPLKRRDEVSDLNESFRAMVGDLRRNREELDSYNARLERALARVRLMEDLEKSLFKLVPREVSQVLRDDPEALERGKTEKDVTVLFLDVEGSTLLTEKLAPETIDQLIQTYFSKFLDPIYDNHGDITETAGDGLMIIFQSEDSHLHACNALLAAVAIREAVLEIHGRLGPEEEKIMVNIGINSGKALVGFTKYESISGARHTFTASGRTTILAARLADQAKNGSILTTSETLQMAAEGENGPPPAIRSQSLGHLKLKNISAPPEVHRILE